MFVRSNKYFNEMEDMSIGGSEHYIFSSHLTKSSFNTSTYCTKLHFLKTSLLYLFRRPDQHHSCNPWPSAHVTFATSLATSALPIKVIFLLLASSLYAHCNWLIAISFHTCEFTELLLDCHLLVVVKFCVCVYAHRYIMTLFLCWKSFQQLFVMSKVPIKYLQGYLPTAWM